MLAASLVAVVAAVTEARTWTNYQGKTIEAEFVRLEGVNAVLQMNGREFPYPLSQLSEADRQYVFQQAAGVTPPVAPAESEPVNPFTPVENDGPNDGPGDDAEDDDRDGGDDSSARSSSGVARTRFWTDNLGNQIRAKFIRIHDGNAILMQGRKLVPCPIQNLSAADRQYVRELLEARGETDLMPSEEILASARNAYSEEGGEGATDMGAGRPYNPPEPFRPPGFTPGAELAGNPMPPDASNPADTLADNPMPEQPESYAASGSRSNSFSGHFGPSFSDPANMGDASPVSMQPNLPEVHVPDVTFTPPSFPQQQLEYYCSNCKKTVPEHVNDRCPHCGIYFSYVEGPGGSRKYNGWRWGAGGGIGFLAALVGMIIKLLISRR